MAFGRVTSNILSRSAIGDIRNNNRDLLALQKQLATGRAFNNISDDPLGVNRVLDFDVTISENEQFLKNVDTGLSELGITDSSIDSLHTMIIRAKEIALAQINGTSSEETRRATAQEVQQILKQIVSVANSQIGNNFIFAGTNSTVQPFKLNGNEVVYTGNSDDRLSQISRSASVATNIPGSRAFGIFNNKTESSFKLEPKLQEKIFINSSISVAGVPAGFTAVVQNPPAGVDLTGLELIITSGQNEGVSTRILEYDEASGAVRFETDSLPIDLVEGTSVAITQAATRISALNGGLGAKLGVILASVGQENFSIDLSSAASVSDVISILENSFDGKVDVELSESGKGFSIKNLSDDVIVIKEEGRNTVGRELGLISSGVLQSIGVGETFQGVDVTPAISASTSLKNLNNGAGISDLGFRIRSGSNEKIFDTNDMEGISTVGDLLNLINGSSIEVQAQINESGSGIEIKGRSSGQGVFVDNLMAKGLVQASSTGSQISIDPSFFKSDNDELIGTQILIKTSDGSTAIRNIIDYDGNAITLDGDVSVDGKSTFEVYSAKRFLGRIDSATTNSFTDTGQFALSKNLLKGALIRITEGSGSGSEFRVIDSNDDQVFFNNPNGVVLDSTSTYEIVTGTAATLGLNTFNASSKISSLQDSRDISLTEIEITYGADQKTSIVDLSKALTMQDVIDKIAQETNFEVIASLVNGNALKLEDSLESAILQNDITIKEVGSGNSALNLGLLGVEGKAGTEFVGLDLQPTIKESNIFTALFDLINGLLSDDVGKLNNAGAKIDESLTIILDARAEVGARLNRFDLTKNRIEDQQIFVQELRSNTLDADYVDLVLKFNNKRDIVEANLRAVSNLLNVSLLDFL